MGCHVRQGHGAASLNECEMQYNAEISPNETRDGFSQLRRILMRILPRFNFPGQRFRDGCHILSRGSRLPALRVSTAAISPSTLPHSTRMGIGEALTSPFWTISRKTI